MSNNGLTDEQIKAYNQKANLKQVIRGGEGDGRNSLVQEILAQDKYKQQVMDGLLKIRRIKKPMQTEDGELYLQEFVRLEDGSGRWRKVSNIPDEEWEEIKKGGAVNPEGAKDVLTTLNALSNNNVSLSNLTQKQINDLGREAALAIDSKLRNKKDEYGIESTDDIEWIMDDIINPNVLAGLSKAKNGAFIGEILRETRIIGSLDDEEDDSSGGVLDFG